MRQQGPTQAELQRELKLVRRDLDHAHQKADDILAELAWMIDDNILDWRSCDKAGRITYIDGRIDALTEFQTKVRLRSKEKIGDKHLGDS